MMQSMESPDDKQKNTSEYNKSYVSFKNGSYNNIETISIFVHKTKARKRKKYKVYTCSHSATPNPRQKQAARRSSLQELCRKKSNLRASKSYIQMKNSYNKNNSTYFVDIARESSLSRVNYSQNTLVQTNLTVYRCQLSTKEESCCCSCNSDAMFEVMKSLYDCYKKKNCDHCNCILCGHLPRDERDKSQVRKTLADIGVTVPKEAEQKEKLKKALSKMIGKSPAEKEKILRDLALSNIALPEPRTASEKNLVEKVRRDLGLPPEPDTPADKAKLRQAELLGIGVIPLEGKTPEQKEKILRAQAEKGLPLPVGRTPSEKALIDKIRASLGKPLPKTTSEKFRQAKTPDEKEKVLRELANQGIPFPDSKTPSERKLMDKIRTELGLPPAPKSPSLREKYNKAGNDGIFQPLEGKTPAQKEKLLQDLADRGIPLPEGRTPSEKDLIAKIRARRTKKTPSEKIRRAKAAGLITPLQGKPPEKKEKILRGLADMGIPFPEGNTPSEKKLINKIRAELGLPPEPKTPSLREKYNKAANDGLILPLDGKTPAEKEKILQHLKDRGIPLPEGRTPSEKAIIAKVKERPSKGGPPSVKLRKAKAAGFLTPLEGKSPERKEKIIRGLANMGLSLPVGKTPSEKKLINKVRAELGLPPDPKTPSLKEKYDKAANEGVMIPLEGKTPIEKEKILQDLQARGIPLPEGRTPSEKSIIAKVKAKPRKMGPPSEKLRKAKAAGFLTPLEGKPLEEKEKIIRGLANMGLPLPEGKSPSEKKLINKVRGEVGLPPEPKTPSLREKYDKAANEGVMIPLEGKTPAEKEKILQDLQARGIPLPEGRTPSEKSIIAKVKAKPRKMGPPSEKLRKAKAAGYLTPLEGKPLEEKEKIIRGLVNMGLPLPEGKSPSEKKLINKVRGEVGLPPEPKTPSLREKYDKAANEGVMIPLEGKTPIEKEKILQDLQARGIPLPEGRTPSEKSIIAKVKAKPRKMGPPSEKLRKAKAAGFLTPLEGKPLEEKEKIIRGLANMGLPLPEGKSPSEKKLINKVRGEVGLPPEPKTPSLREKYDKAANEGVMIPLEGKTPAEKEKILQDLQARGIPLPEGRTPSEKSIIAKVKAKPRKMGPPSEKLRKAKAAGFLTPLEGKPLEEKEKIIRGLANMGLPLPEGKSPSEKKLINKVRGEVGLPPEPKTPSLREKYDKAANEGVMIPLEGKTPAEKETILQDLQDRGIPLPEGRTPSEKSIIAKVKAKPRKMGPPSEKLRKAKAAGFLMPLEGKLPEEKEKIIRGLANMGLLLPEGKTPSEMKLINKVRAELGLPPEPKTPSLREKYNNAANEGVLLPLEGKTPAEKEKILQDFVKRGIPLPEGRTPSEKSLIEKLKVKPKAFSLSEKMRKAKEAGFITPIKGKSPEDKEKILRGLANLGLPLPEGKSKSEKDIILKVRADLGLPPEPATPEMRDKYNKAANDGVMLPLEGKTPDQKEKNLIALADRGIPLPVGRTPSEKSLIAKVQARIKPLSIKTRPSERLRKAKAAGLLTPLTGKTPEQKENILKGLALHGLPLPEGKTPSDKKLIEKVRADLGLPPDPKTPSLREKYKKAAESGLMVPLEGKTPAEKEKILQDLADRGIPLPAGRTPSEKSMIAKVKSRARPPSEGRRSKRDLGPPALPDQERKLLDDKTVKVMKEGKGPSDECICSLLTPESERARISKALAPGSILAGKLREAKAASLLTSLEGKTPEQKEKILRGLAKQGLPLPESKTPSEKHLMDRIRADFGLPPEPKTAAQKNNYAKAQAAGIITPLEGKTPAQKEKTLRGLAAMGVPLPEGRSPSEKALIASIKKSLPASKAESTGITSEKIRKAKAAGLLTPIEGKTPEQKEKILRGLAKAGFPLPEGKTPSDKSLIRKIKSELKIPKDTAAERMRKARAAGLITPLIGKTPAQKEKIVRDLAAAGLPLPEGKTPSEKPLVKKVKAETGYVTPTPSMRKAQAAGLLTPLAGKTPAQKEKVLRKMQEAGIPLPEGSTPSEKSLIGKLKAEKKRTPSQKLKEAKALGLLTPLDGKTPAQKEKILKGLAKAGLPLPEGKNPSEKELINKVRNDLGLPPEPKSPSIRDKMRKALEAGIITPLEGKTPEQKAKILADIAEAGIPLPIGRTPSEKALIQKVQALKRPSKVTSEMLRKAKAAGLLTPLDGKKPSEKEKIIRGLADLGMPLPSGKTSSEKSLINKIRTEKGIPPPVETPSEKEIVLKAKVEGLLTPIAGKTPKEKERILRGLAEAGLPLPSGTTPSEKSLVKKIRAEAGLPLEPTPSEKRGKIKTKAKKVGAGSMKMQKGAIGEEFQDIIKTTKCDRGCGCDKKKIRFKHSYVKIRVTSPDFSSICECPNECFPGIKGGIITDNEGIKVTVGSAVGVPSYFKELTHDLVNSRVMTISVSKTNLNNDEQYTSESTNPKKIPLNISTERTSVFYKSIINPESSEIRFRTKATGYALDYITSNFNSNESLIYSPYDTGSDKTFAEYYDVVVPASFKNWTEDTEEIYSSEFSNTPISITLISSDCTTNNIYTSSVSSIRTEPSLQFSESCNIRDNLRKSLTSLSSENNLADDSIIYLNYQTSKIVDDSTLLHEFVPKSKSKDLNYLLGLTKDKRKLLNVSKEQNEFLIFQVTQNKFDYEDVKDLSMNDESAVIVSNFDNNPEIVKMVDKLLAKSNLSDASLFLVVPSSDDNSFENTSVFSSRICIHDSLTDNTWDNSNSTVSMKNRISVGVSPQDNQFYYAPAQDINFAETTIPADLSTSIKEKYVKDELQKRKPDSVTDEVKRTDFLDGTSNQKPKKHKKYFLKRTRYRVAKSKDIDSISTSASSVSVHKKQKKYSCKSRKQRSVSRGSRANAQYKSKHLDQTYNKDRKVPDEDIQLKTLYKSEKRRSHKRCQVITKSKGDRRHPVKTTGSQKRISSNAGQSVDSRVFCSVDQCAERTEINTIPLLANERKYISEGQGNKIDGIHTPSEPIDCFTCPVHGPRRRYEEEFESENSLNDVCNNEEPSNHLQCPVHGYNAVPYRNVNNVSSCSHTSPHSNYGSSEEALVFPANQSFDSRHSFVMVKNLFNKLSSLNREAVSCQCDPETTNVTTECQCRPPTMDDKTNKSYDEKKVTGKKESSKRKETVRGALVKRDKDKKDFMCACKSHESDKPPKSKGKVKNKGTQVDAGSKKSKSTETAIGDKPEKMKKEGIDRGVNKALWDKEAKSHNKQHVVTKKDNIGNIICECSTSEPPVNTAAVQGAKESIDNKGKSADYPSNGTNSKKKEKQSRKTADLEKIHRQPEKLSRTQAYDGNINSDENDSDCVCIKNRKKTITYEKNKNETREEYKDSSEEPPSQTPIDTLYKAPADVSHSSLNDSGDQYEDVAPKGLLMPGEYHDLQLLYLRDVMKMISDCSQATSGFTLNMSRRTSETENLPSYEEVLKFYKKHKKKRRQQQCFEDCDIHTQHYIQDIDCGCPYSTMESGNMQRRRTLKGLKVALGAKGRATKGLSGIMCFNMQTNFKDHRVKSLESIVNF